jgi:hypothetical protein
VVVFVAATASAVGLALPRGWVPGGEGSGPNCCHVWGRPFIAVAWGVFLGGLAISFALWQWANAKAGKGVFAASPEGALGRSR